MNCNQILTSFLYQQCFRLPSKFFLVLAICLIFSASGHGEDKHLTIATLNYPPYEFVREGQVDGITVRIVKQVFENMGQPIELVELPWSRGVEYLKSGKVDALFEVLWKKEREEFADYSSEVLMYETASLFVKQSASIIFNGDILDLKPYSIGVRQDFSYGARFDEAREGKKFKEVIPSVDPVHLLLLLNHDRIDILIGDKYAIPHLAKQAITPKPLEPIKRLTPDVDDTPSYLVFSKIKRHQKIRDQFDLELIAIKESGAYQAIVDDWVKYYKPEL